MPQDVTPSPPTGRPHSRVAIAGGVDRATAFRKAKRHTAVVRTLRVLLPLSAVAMFASYGLFMQRSLSFSFGNKKVEVSGLSISREALVAHNPRYAGFDKSGGEFEVRAATAEQDLKQKGIVRLKAIDGRTIDANRQVTTLKSPRGTLDTNTNVLEMYERIDVASQNGMTAELTRATVHTKDNRIVSEEPVTVRMPTGTVHGKAMTIEQKLKQVLFTGGVVANLKGQPKPAAAAPSVQAADPAMRGSQSQPQAGLGRSDAPVDITAQRLLIDDVARTATFSGNVVAKQTDSVLETRELEVSYDGQPPAGQAASPAKSPGIAAAGDGSNRLRKLIARSDVVLTRGAERATGSSGEFDAVTDRATLLGPVVISAGPDRGATADRADIDNKSDSILLTGNVVVTQQKNVMKGRRLLANRKDGTVTLESPANAGLPKGQINAKLYQAESEGAAAKKGPAPAAAATKPPVAPPVASPVTSPFGAGARGDPSQPIDIDADRLDVDDRKKTAIFRGRVKAVQGNYVISTDQLDAHYSGDGGLALAQPPGGASPATPSAAQPKTGAQLDKVVAPRKVDIVAKDGQRAQGNSAVFNPKTNTATLTGDVTLTQGTTITTGPCALLDMNTGLMKIIEACGYSSSGGAVASTAAPAKPPRAQLLIFPGLVKEEQKALRDKAAAGNPGSGAAPASASGKSPAPSPPPAASPAAAKPPPPQSLRPPAPPKVEDAKSSLF